MFGSHVVVLLPYRFTLFSNVTAKLEGETSVLLPYRFTLFSNSSQWTFQMNSVLLPYRFTLFSNIIIEKIKENKA